MPTPSGPWGWLAAALGCTLALYALTLLALMAAGRRSEAVAFGRFVPDCVVLFRRLLVDPRVGRARKLLVVALLGYLAVPVDLVPDFLPVVGQLDDAVLVAFVLRVLVRGVDESALRALWPGPASSWSFVARLAGVSTPTPGGYDPPGKADEEETMGQGRDEDHRFVVRGMTCEHCVASVREEVSDVPGVSRVDVDLDTGRMSVAGEGVDPEAVGAAVREAGYEVAA